MAAPPGRQRTARTLLLAAAASLLTSGCASAVPALTGGSTTHQGRFDALAGGAVRVPVDAPSVPDPGGTSTSAVPRSAGSGGAVPVVGGRYGLTDAWDLGLLVGGTTARAEVRREWPLKEDITRPAVVLGMGLVAGWVPGDGLGEGQQGDGFRLGGELPLLYAVEFGGVYDVWAGARFGIEHVRGPFALSSAEASADASATALRPGAVLGMGVGLRRVHALLELSAYYEHWMGQHGPVDLDGGGVVLVPAFALRVRI